jgi:hypothetical protein
MKMNYILSYVVQLLVTSDSRSGALRTVKLRAPPVSGTTGAIKLAVR